MCDSRVCFSGGHLISDAWLIVHSALKNRMQYWSIILELFLVVVCGSRNTKPVILIMFSHDSSGKTF